MSNKLRGLLVAMLAAAACVAVSAVAQAEPQFHVNGVAQSTAHQNVTQFGELKMKSLFWGSITCKVIIGAPVWNEATEGLPVHGIESYEGWEPFVCSMPECLKGKAFISAEGAVKLEETENLKHEKIFKAVRGASSLPWPARTVPEPESTVGLHMGNTEKLPLQPVKFLVNCPGEGFEVPYEGTLKPHLVNGTKNGLKPSHLRFETSEKTGFLITPDICGGECAMANLTVEGEVTMLGTGQQLITAE
jgi:hypothetical protein